ncbi:MAG: AI-2E family transporter, partial [Clostridia bacterium]|nr:AI-2E family transporter [Clostridia bacterium]
MSLNKVEKRRNFIINIVYLAIVLALAFLFIEYAIKWVMPFLIGFLISFVFRPLILLIEKRCKINKRIGAFIVIIIGYGFLGFLVWLIGDALFDSIKEFCLNIPNLYTNEIAPFLGDANNGFLSFMERFSPEIAAQAEKTLSEVLTNIQVSLVEISANVLSALAGASTKLPFILISLIFTILSSLFISMDYDHVIDFIVRQIPEKHRTMIIDIKSYLGKTLVGYLRAYLILMSITFVELSVGFLALRVNNPFGIAAITAIADALPILGTGTVVLPWAVISLFQQRF